MYLRSCLNRVRVVHPDECMPVVIAQELLDAQAMPASARAIPTDGSATASFTASDTRGEIRVDSGEFSDPTCPFSLPHHHS